MLKKSLNTGYETSLPCLLFFFLAGRVPYRRRDRSRKKQIPRFHQPGEGNTLVYLFSISASITVSLS